MAAPVSFIRWLGDDCYSESTQPPSQCAYEPLVRGRELGDKPTQLGFCRSSRHRRLGAQLRSANDLKIRLTPSSAAAAASVSYELPETDTAAAVCAAPGSASGAHSSTIRPCC